MEEGLCFLAPALEPLTKLPDGEAIIPVVGGDRLEDGGLGGFQPALVFNDREARTGAAQEPHQRCQGQPDEQDGERPREDVVDDLVVGRFENGSAPGLRPRQG